MAGPFDATNADEFAGAVISKSTMASVSGLVLADWPRAKQWRDRFDQNMEQWSSMVMCLEAVNHLAVITSLGRLTSVRRSVVL